MSVEFTITAEMLAAHAEWLRTKDTKTPSGTRIVVPPGVDLSGVDLSGANLGGANLRCANLGGADLRCAYLAGVDLGDANLRGANLGDANLRGAYLGGANLGDANLGDANLRGAYLGGADLGGAYLGGADLRGANLRGANFGGTAVGYVGSYGWMSWLEKDGTRVLRFGCETHPLADWPALCGPLARKHENGQADFYERATAALVAFCAALDAEKGGAA